MMYGTRMKRIMRMSMEFLPTEGTQGKDVNCKC
jgi:hypothetical protein